jgi:hypothetical protein
MAYILLNKMIQNFIELTMIRKKILSQKTFVITLAIGIILCSAFPGYSASWDSENESDPEQKDSPKFEMLAFRLSQMEQKGESNFPLFTITNSHFSVQNLHFSTLKQSEETSPRIAKRLTKKANPLGNSLYTASLLTLTALNIADTISTVKALQLPGLEEGNPIMRPFTKNILLFSTVKLSLTALDFYLLKNIYKKNKTLGWVLSIVGNIAMSYVVSNNIRKIQSVTRQ